MANPSGLTVPYWLRRLTMVAPPKRGRARTTVLAPAAAASKPDGPNPPGKAITRSISPLGRWLTTTSSMVTLTPSRGAMADVVSC